LAGTASDRRAAARYLALLKRSDVLSDLFLLVGFVLILVGLWWAFPPLALILAGTALLLVGVLLQWKEVRRLTGDHFDTGKKSKSRESR
jgi:divalent metal cation (Fe/Co/Zn/Cd) transporter